MRAVLFALLATLSVSPPAFADDADDLARALNGGGAAPSSPAPSTPAPSSSGTDYASAKNTFQALSHADRFTQQIALTGLGFLYAVPNEDFNTRIFKATKDFQSANGVDATGVLDDATCRLIIQKSKPLFRAWQFRLIEVAKGINIWMPVGPDFVEHILAAGEAYIYTDDTGFDAMEIHVMRFHGTVHAAYTALLEATPGAVIGYKVERPDWFVINSDTMEKDQKVTRYMRVQADRKNGGVVGVMVIYSGDRDPFLAGRVATIVTDSLAAATMGSPFINPPAQKQLVGD